MEYSLRQARYSNPDSQIILLGDESNDRFDFVTHVNMKDYFSSAQKFAEVYRHFSSNSYNYELFCFQRWFALDEYMEESGIDEVFVIDSDIMLYVDMTTFMKKFNGSGAETGFFYQDNLAANACSSYWTQAMLKRFCEYMIYMYTDNLSYLKEWWAEFSSRKQLGGICDMTAAGMFNNDTPELAKLNFHDCFGDSTFDGNINIPDGRCQNEYKFKRIKEVFVKDNLPFVYNIQSGKAVLFNTLHFQGPAKYLIARFYTGARFKGKILLDIKFFFANIAAFWYIKLKIRYRFAWVFDLLNRRK
jgi:hypothetical protein